jgi:hypothetical protein
MGWFKKIFGFSSQDAIKDLADLPHKGIDLVLDPLGAEKWNPIPTWDELQRPGQYLSGKVDTLNSSFLPDSWERWAVPVEAGLMGLFNPFAGAGFLTAYNAGKMQETQKGMDWGKVGRDAAVNFGTAAAANWAKNIQAKDAANASRAKAFSGGAPSALQSTADTAKASTQGAMAAFPSGTSLSKVPIQQLQTSSGGFGNALKTAGLKAAPKVAEQALTATLAPEAATPISGFDEAASGGGGTSALKYGDVLRAFGNPNMIVPDEKGGYTVDPTASARGYQAIAANNWLQKAARRDQFMPAGQVRSLENTPYERQLYDINNSTEQYYKDFDEELRQAAMTKALMSENPWMTQDQVMEYTADPSKVPETMRPFFQQLKPVFY